VLRVGNRRVPGQATDSQRELFAFDVGGLEPDLEETASRYREWLIENR